MPRNRGANRGSGFFPYKTRVLGVKNGGVWGAQMGGFGGPEWGVLGGPRGGSRGPKMGGFGGPPGGAWGGPRPLPGISCTKGLKSGL